MSYNGVKVAHIVATDLNGCIGKDNKLPWHISDDLKRFKEITQNNVIVMGRKTFESLGCKALPKRMNVIITRNHSHVEQDPSDCSDGNLWTATTIESALGIAAKRTKSRNLETFWIIGGGEIYAQTMQYVDVIERTFVHTNIEGGDVFYPPVPKGFSPCMSSPNHQDEKSGLIFHYRKFVR